MRDSGRKVPVLRTQEETSTSYQKKTSTPLWGKGENHDGGRSLVVIDSSRQRRRVPKVSGNPLYPCPQKGQGQRVPSWSVTSPVDPCRDVPRPSSLEVTVGFFPSSVPVEVSGIGVFTTGRPGTGIWDREWRTGEGDVVGEYGSGLGVIRRLLYVKYGRDVKGL